MHESSGVLPPLPTHRLSMLNKGHELFPGPPVGTGKLLLNYGLVDTGCLESVLR